MAAAGAAGFVGADAEAGTGVAFASTLLLDDDPVSTFRPCFGSSSNSLADKHPSASNNPAKPFRFRFFFCIGGLDVAVTGLDADADADVGAGAFSLDDAVGPAVVGLAGARGAPADLDGDGWVALPIVLDGSVSGMVGGAGGCGIVDVWVV